MLKFATFASDVELPFWASLASHKLDKHKLDDSARKLLGAYEIRPSDSPESSCRLQIHGNALTSDTVSTSYYRAYGIIRNVNTIEKYQNLDKTAVLTQAAHNIWNAISDGTIFSCPSLLSTFVVICFADLKKYKFTHLFGFPALHSEPAWRFTTHHDEGDNDTRQVVGPQDRVLKLDLASSKCLSDAIQDWRSREHSRQHGFFLARKHRRGSGSEGEARSSESDQGSQIEKGNTNESNPWTVEALGSYEKGFFDGVAETDQYVGFADPSTYPEYPGWLLRNLLILVRHRWKLQRVRILCYRDVPGHESEARSIILPIEMTSRGSEQIERDEPGEMPKVTGWERNSAGKIVSKVVNVGEYLDPQRLADQAVDLNLKLMRWRIAPTLDLDRIKNTRCLLLGAGTLGSYVSRILLGWGVRKITFVDNGIVSFSNPVRQPLFKHSDCLDGGSAKAHQAAKALQEVYPGVDSQGFVMSVPMAAHPITEESKTESEFEILKRLIHEHDAIFLLMDSRESRWLPSVIGKATGKIVLNAALGFDTFVVMRHGLRDPQKPEDELGCYFCNDVVAPADSTSDRTLDQQCTVTRPGIAALASALLVEIFVSVLQHPRGALAPASRPGKPPEERDEHPLGIVPHQIRGYLATFQNVVVRGKAYDSCSACSDKVVAAYSSDEWTFVKRALNEKGYVEKISGLAEIQRAAEKAILEMEASELDVDNDEEIEIM